MKDQKLPTTLEDAHLEIQKLREVCAEAYQVLGVALIGEPRCWTDADAARALDNVSAAANGDPIPHQDLLPWPLQQGAVKRTDVTIARWAVIRTEGAGSVEAISTDRSNAMLTYTWSYISKEPGFDFETWWKENAKKKHLVVRKVRITTEHIAGVPYSGWHRTPDPKTCCEWDMGHDSICIQRCDMDGKQIVDGHHLCGVHFNAYKRHGKLMLAGMGSRGDAHGEIGNEAAMSSPAFLRRESQQIRPK